jgi:hypothetical protein
MSPAGGGCERLPYAARRALWNRLWDKLLQPLPSEVVPDQEQLPLPDSDGARARRTELPR